MLGSWGRWLLGLVFLGGLLTLVRLASAWRPGRMCNEF